MADTYAAARDQYLQALQRMASRYDDVPRQRSPEWYSVKTKSIGGSELATLMGINPFSSRAKMLARKAGIDGGFAGGTACRWGTMFEPVSEDLVAAAFNCPVIGTDIHIRSEALPAHANSPDGYTVVALEASESGLDLCLNPVAAAAAGNIVIPIPSLVELKAPYSRLPKGEVPKYYVPQLKSGMALSPVTSTGLYVEVVYRLCTLDDLVSGSEAYALKYHKKDAKHVARKGPIWPSPAALGITAVYAPKMGTRRARRASVAIGARGGDHDALDLLLKCCGGTPGSAGDLIDFGRAADECPADFDKALRNIDSGEFEVRHSKSHMCENGENVSGLINSFMQDAEAGPAPDNYYLLGYIPWKVMQADYHLVPKDPDYMEVIRGPVESFMADLAALTSADDVRAAYSQLMQSSAPTVADRLKKADISTADLAALAALHNSAT
jgi:hypothetical protein